MVLESIDSGDSRSNKPLAPTVRADSLRSAARPAAQRPIVGRAGVVPDGQAGGVHLEELVVRTEGQHALA
jgi:hypothetical protein